MRRRRLIPREANPTSRGGNSISRIADGCPPAVVGMPHAHASSKVAGNAFINFPHETARFLMSGSRTHVGSRHKGGHQRPAEAKRALDEEVVPMARQQAGFVGGYWIQLDGDHGTSIELFESEGQARAAF